MTTLTVLRVTIEIEGPWLVGDPDGLGDVDTAPLQEMDGTPQVPATSLAGSLRSHLADRPDLDVAAWMGEVRRGEEDQSGVASRLRVLGVRLAGGGRRETRTTTAVDATTASAHKKALRREQYVDAATTLSAYMVHDGPPDPPLLEALASWRPVVGQRRTNGWGCATVTEVKHAGIDLRDREQLVRWLSGGGPEQIDELLTNVAGLELSPVVAERDLLRVRFAVPVGVHVGAGELSESEPTGRGSETRRVSDIVYRNGSPYVPASSWRGVLRSHAMFVLRSLGCSPDGARAAVEGAFGSSRQRGLLTFHDSTMGATASIEDHEHVAIDRITGGARNNLLFTDRAAAGSIELRVTSMQPDDVPRWVHSLLGHAVRDFADGFLAVGGRTTRGLGSVQLTEWQDAVVPRADGIDIEQVGA